MVNGMIRNGLETLDFDLVCFVIEHLRPNAGVTRQSLHPRHILVFTGIMECFCGNGRENLSI